MQQHLVCYVRPRQMAFNAEMHVEKSQHAARVSTCCKIPACCPHCSTHWHKSHFTAADCANIYSHREPILKSASLHWASHICCINLHSSAKAFHQILEPDCSHNFIQSINKGAGWGWGEVRTPHTKLWKKKPFLYGSDFVHRKTETELSKICLYAAALRLELTGPWKRPKVHKVTLYIKVLVINVS